MVRIKRTWSDSDLISATKIAQCLGDVIDSLGLVRGGSYKSIKSHIKRLALDTSHFLSPAELAKRARSFIKPKTKEELFVEDGQYHDYKRVKEMIIREHLLEYKCSICGIFEWLGQKLNLQMDHINGINNDNRLENLRLLCPCCHSLTSNFCGKNRKSTPKEKNHCIVCKVEIGRTSIWCKKCSGINKETKIIWPSKEELIVLTQKYGFVETGRKLGVSDNAIRKRIKNH